MAGQAAISRWTRFLTSFDHIDAAIEAAEPSVSRDEFRRLRVQILEMLCAAQDDHCKAKELCLILYGVMEESLATLQTLPADVVPKILASSPDLANAVGALRSHRSERVRGLARDIIRGWKATVEGDIVRMTAAVAKLDAVSRLPPSKSRAPYVSDGRNDNAPSNPTKREQEGKPCPTKAVPLVVNVPPARTTVGASAPRKTAPAAGIGCATTADKPAPVKMDGFRSDNLCPEAKSYHTRIPFQGNPPRAKKMAPVVVEPGRDKAYVVSPLPEQPAPVSSVRHGVRTLNTNASTKVWGTKRRRRWSSEEKMEATKRKLHEGYQEAADAKRQRKIQVIEDPKMLEQRQRKIHPIMRERSRARSGNPTAVRRSLLPSFH